MVENDEEVELMKRGKGYEMELYFSWLDFAADLEWKFCEVLALRRMDTLKIVLVPCDEEGDMTGNDFVAGF